MKKQIKNSFFVLFGSFLLAFATSFFLVPMKFSTGGLGGVATVLFYVGKIPLSVTVFTLNLFLFAIGWKNLSRASLFQSFLGSFFISLFLRLLSPLNGYQGDPFIASMFGGVLSGMGVGLTLRVDASTGGTDFAALLFTKRIPHLSPSFFIMLMDTAIISASALVFRDVTGMLYSIFSLFISNRVIDFVLAFGDRSKSFFIVSQKTDLIAKDIMKLLGRGVTFLSMETGFEKRKGNLIFCAVRSREAPRLLAIVQHRDPAAFSVAFDAVQVKGEGF